VCDPLELPARSLHRRGVGAVAPVSLLRQRYFAFALSSFDFGDSPTAFTAVTL
jgi:hypothetical protein